MERGKSGQERTRGGAILWKGHVRGGEIGNSRRGKKLWAWEA